MILYYSEHVDSMYTDMLPIDLQLKIDPQKAPYAPVWFEFVES